MLDITDLAKSYGARRVFDGWSSRADAGVTWVRGANGSGKTTLLECLAGIEPYQRGSITLRSSNELSLVRSRNAYLQRVFYVPNRIEVHPRITIGDFSALVRNGKGDIDAAAVTTRAAAFGVFAQPTRAISSLSFGTQKKLMLSLALASDCPVLLLDEPTEGLDAAAVEVFEVGIRSAVDRVWIVASHDADFMGRLEPTIVDLP